ncbi:hypothetical protein G7078_04655 [Sphingomonas sinipercae]|uniref:Uncharacterized protein n=1 Tax=Sphingomonas sinipercae TaxID=2714944 RepID=A0A6G7ZMM1_9SPHN|nr:hypothetical protein [Sphingomonas sinipercae]QIL02146.1 hypothetical protein G7078_04655 [Sphingomonas sinipercae]
MNDTKSERSAMSRSLGRALLGAVVGAVGTALLLALVGERYIDLDDGAAMLTLAVGAIYALIGLAVGVGAIAPGAGARFLNVEDADEVREDRPRIALGALSCLLVGLFLLTLVLSGGSGSLLSAQAALVIASFCVLGLVAIALRLRGGGDEMSQQVGREASSLAMSVTTLVFGGWAGLWHLGYAGPIQPLVLVSGFAAIQLLASFWAIGRKGLMAPRFR